MIRKTLVAVALAGLCTLGATGVASAATAPAEPARPSATPWIPIFYFGTQTYCTQAGALGQQTGALQPGAWKCDSGWLLVQPQMG